MRLDKYLKVSRLIKRRTLAKEACDSGRITINGRAAKAGTITKIGDTIEMDFGRRVVQIRVLEVRESASAEAARTMYEVLSESKKPDD